MKRKSTDFIVIHASATVASLDVGAAEIRRWHSDPKPQGRGWSDIGYHFVIRRNGSVEIGRPVAEQGAHVNMSRYGGKSYNPNSVAICLVGGLDDQRQPAHNFTRFQMWSLAKLVTELKEQYPDASVCGHRDLSPDKNNDGIVDSSEWVKACPCFDAAAWWAIQGQSHGDSKPSKNQSPSGKPGTLSGEAKPALEAEIQA